MGHYVKSTNPSIIDKVPPGKSIGVEKTSAYTVTVADEFLIGDGTSAVVPFTLPALSTIDADTVYQFTFVAKNVTNAVTVVADAADTGKINGGDSVAIPVAYAGFIVRNVEDSYWVALPMQVNT